MAVMLLNNARATLASSVSASATTLSVASGQGARFPVPSGGDWFPLALEDTSGNIEICRATARNSDSITVERGQEGSMARAFDAGSACELRLTTDSFLAFVLQNVPSDGAGGIDPSQVLQRINNLSDVPSKSQARDNLEVYSRTEVDGKIPDAALTLKKANNLSDVADAADARANLGVYGWGQVDDLIAQAIGGIDPGGDPGPSPFVPSATDSVGAYRIFVTLGMSSTPTHILGQTVQGSTFGVGGTWRVHGIMQAWGIDSENPAVNNFLLCVRTA